MKNLHCKYRIGHTNYTLKLNNDGTFYAFTRSSCDYTTYIPKELIDQIVQEQVKKRIQAKISRIFDL